MRSAIVAVGIVPVTIVAVTIVRAIAVVPVVVAPAAERVEGAPVALRVAAAVGFRVLPARAHPAAVSRVRVPEVALAPELEGAVVARVVRALVRAVAQAALEAVGR